MQSDYGLLTERTRQLLLQPRVDARAVELVRALERLDHLSRLEHIDADGTVGGLARLGPFGLLVAEGSVGVDDVDDLLLGELVLTVLFLLVLLLMLVVVGVAGVEGVAREVHLDVLWIHVARAHAAQVAEDVLYVLEDTRNVRHPWHPTHLEVGVLRAAVTLMRSISLESIPTKVELEILLLTTILPLVWMTAFYVNLSISYL